MMINERRWAHFHAAPEMIISTLMTASQPRCDGERRFLSLPKLELPDGYRLVRLNYDPRRDAFVVMVEHESFDPVPPGVETPCIDPVMCTTVEVDIKNEPPTDRS